MNFCSIASGSSGNCIYVGSDNHHVLIDAGISGKRIEAGLHKAGLEGKELDGILVTHEHSDHIKGLGVLSRKWHVPIYATAGTNEAIRCVKSLGKMDPELFHDIAADHKFQMGDLEISPFHIFHDAADPVAYRISAGGKSVAVATDIGHYDDYIIRQLSGLDGLLLESNHDVRMLQVGNYPYPLKQRILSDYGHLSNENAGRLLGEILNDHLEYIYLGHLSKENNYEMLALETVCAEVTLGENPYQAQDFRIAVAGRETETDVVRI